MRPVCKYIMLQYMRPVCKYIMLQYMRPVCKLLPIIHRPNALADLLQIFIIK